MPELSYDAFKDYVKDHIKEFLSAEYQDYDMKFNTVSRAGYEYDALMINTPSKDGVSVVPALNLTAAYEDYQNGRDMNDILDRLADTRMNATIPGFSKEDVMSWERAQDRLVARVINTAANKDYLADKPHKNVADLSVIYSVKVQEDSNGFAAAVVTDDLMELWGVDQEKLHEVAMQNVSEYPIFFQNIESALFGIIGKDQLASIDIEDIELSDYSLPFFILTNEQKVKGAILALDPKTMDRITDKFGPVYILPSSVDEVLIVPQSVAGDVQSLAALVTEVNAHEVKPEDQLSNRIYTYDKDSKTIQFADKGIEHDKTQNKDKGIER